MWLRNRSLTWALAGRDLQRHFNNPLGYLLLTAFVVLSAIAAFWPARFFLDNLANLQRLNAVFPLLLGLFVPALTMGIWADERKHGTDELLLTLPADEWDITAGKYIAVLGVYTAAILLSSSHILVLMVLGRPDPGLTIANYLGFWIAGAGLIPVGMLASLVHPNTTISFILGAVFSGILTGLSLITSAFGMALERRVAPLGVADHFQSFSIGLIDVADVVYFVALAALFLYLNTVLLGRLRWPDRPRRRLHRFHVVARAIMLAILLASATVIMARAHWRLDVTAERQHSLSEATRRLVSDLSADRPIVIQAFVSPQVPQAHVQSREDLLAVLRAIAALNPSALQVHVEEAIPYSPVSQLARERYGITPRAVADPFGDGSTQEVYLGVALRAGADEHVVPFLERGLSAEYEVTRALRVVTNSGRKRIGVIDPDVRLFGGVGSHNAQLQVPWQVVDELRKQYEVVEITPYAAITEAVDALLVVLPSRLTVREMALVTERIKKGTPALILVDPLSLVDLNLAPASPMASQINPFKKQGPSVQVNYGDVRQMLIDLGVNWAPARIAWDRFNPHPAMGGLPSEAVFVTARNGNPDAFNRSHDATRTLDEVLMLYPGYVLATEGSSFKFEPLLQTGAASGATGFFQVTRPTPTGPVLASGNAGHQADGRQYVLAAHVRSDMPTNVIVVADLDFISDYFFDLRRAAPVSVRFDNITFFLNAVDVLAGDPSFIALRNRPSRSRTLDRVEAETQRFLERRSEQEQAAGEAARAGLQAARERLQRRIAEIKERHDLDELDRELMIRNHEASETRRLRALEEALEQERNATVQASRETMERQVQRIRRDIRLEAAFLPAVPVLILGVGMFARRRSRERQYARASRRFKERW